MNRLPETYRIKIVAWLASGRTVSEVEDLARAAGIKVSRGTISGLRPVAGLPKGQNPRATPPAIPLDGPLDGPQAPADLGASATWGGLLAEGLALSASDLSGAAIQTSAARLVIRSLRGLLGAADDGPHSRGSVVLYDVATGAEVRRSEAGVALEAAPVPCFLPGGALRLMRARLRLARVGARPRAAADLAGCEAALIELQRPVARRWPSPGPLLAEHLAELPGELVPPLCSALAAAAALGLQVLVRVRQGEGRMQIQIWDLAQVPAVLDLLAERPAGHVRVLIDGRVVGTLAPDDICAALGGKDRDRG